MLKRVCRSTHNVCNKMSY